MDSGCDDGDEECGDEGYFDCLECFVGCGVGGLVWWGCGSSGFGEHCGCGDGHECE